MADDVTGTQAVPQPAATPAPAQVAAPVVNQELWEDGKPFDAAKAKELIEKLRNENKDLKPKAKRADELEAAEQKRKDAELSELEKANKRIAELETKTKAAERREMQRQAAEKHKLPAALAERLKGETAEEIEADAEELFKTLPKTQQQGSPTNPPSGGVVKTDQQMREFLRGGPLPK